MVELYIGDKINKLEHKLMCRMTQKCEATDNLKKK